MLVHRTEQHIIDRQSKWYKMLMEKCHQAKNIYNHGNYLIRKAFIDRGKWLRYIEVEQLVKNDDTYTDYWDWNLANSGQQVLRQLDRNWKSFFKSIKDLKPRFPMLEVLVFARSLSTISMHCMQSIREQQHI